ncbi:MAG: dipeptidase [Pseudomonadota bacterium]
MFRAMLPLLAACLFAAAGCSSQGDTAPSPAAQQLGNQIGAYEIAERALIVDTHIDLPYRLHVKNEDVSRAAGGDFDFPRAQQGGLNAAFMSINVPASVDAQGGAAALADELIGDMEALMRAAPEQFAAAHCVADLAAAKAAGRISLPLGMENGGPIAGSLDELRRYFRRGVRSIALAHSRSNHIADSSYDSEEHWGGLSPFGVELVAAMNTLGVMVDISNLSDQAAWDVLEVSQAPVIASHSSLRHFTPGWQRNMSDEMVVALGRAGGVIQINYGSSFVTQQARAYAERLAAAASAYAINRGIDAAHPAVGEFREQYRAAYPYPYAATDHVLDHIDRAVELAGIDAVGIGSDFDGVGDTLPIGLKDVSSYPALIAGLLDRGYALADIQKILGGNLLRVWRANEVFGEAAGTPVSCALGR